MKVLIVIDNLETGGIANVVNNFCELFINEIIFDFITYIEPSEESKIKIKGRGGKIFIIKRITNTFPNLYIKAIEKIIRENGKYLAIHIHTCYFIWLAALAAKRQNINVRIGHAHGSESLRKNLIIKIIETVGRILNRKYCTIMLSCAESSGKYTFGKDYIFLPNIVNISNDKISNGYLYNEIDCKNKNILGYLGMFSEIKNTKFLIELARYLKINSMNEYIIIAAGTGVDFDRIKEIKLEMNLDNLLLLGYRRDSNELLKLFDVLLVPSVSEGMSLSILESQLIGTPVIVSKGVPDTNNLMINSFCKMENYIPENWIKTFNTVKKYKKYNSRSDINKILENIHYDKKSIKKLLFDAYCGVLNDKRVR